MIILFIFLQRGQNISVFGQWQIKEVSITTVTKLLKILIILTTLGHFIR